MPTEIEKLNIKISTPTEVLWAGEVESVSGENSQGKFDILPYHANFITLIQNNPITIRVDKAERQFSFKTAVIRASNNTVRVYGDI